MPILPYSVERRRRDPRRSGCHAGRLGGPSTRWTRNERGIGLASRLAPASPPAALDSDGRQRWRARRPSTRCSIRVHPTWTSSRLGGSVLWTPASSRFEPPSTRFRLPIWSIAGASWSRSGRRPRSCSGRRPRARDASAAVAVAGTGSPTDARPDGADPGLPLRPRRGAHGQRAPARVRLGAGLRRVPAPLGCERGLAVHSVRPRGRLPHLHRRTLAARGHPRLPREPWDLSPGGTNGGLAHCARPPAGWLFARGRLSSAASCSAGSRLSRACTATSMRRAAPGSRGP